MGVRREALSTPRRAGTRASGFVGRRLLEAGAERGGDYELDENVHISLRVTF